MRISPPFDPIEVGEIDRFGFDFTKDCADGVYILSTTWTCRLSPYSAGSDPAPQSRVSGGPMGSGWQVTTVTIGNGVAQPGQWSVANIGPMPPSARGATYVLDAVAYLSDGRQVAYSSTVQCVLPGQ
jgi:hypothetical protein